VDLIGEDARSDARILVHDADDLLGGRVKMPTPLQPLSSMIGHTIESTPSDRSEKLRWLVGELARLGLRP
jgi:hypothetical protein